MVINHTNLNLLSNLIFFFTIILNFSNMYKRVCADWLPQTCGRTEAVSNKITRGNTNEYNLLKQFQHNSLLTKYISSLKQLL